MQNRTDVRFLFSLPKIGHENFSQKIFVFVAFCKSLDKYDSWHYYKNTDTTLARKNWYTEISNILKERRF